MQQDFQSSKKFFFSDALYLTSKYVLNIRHFISNNANAIHSLFQFIGNKRFPAPPGWHLK